MSTGKTKVTELKMSEVPLLLWARLWAQRINNLQQICLMIAKSLSAQSVLEWLLYMNHSMLPIKKLLFQRHLQILNLALLTTWEEDGRSHRVLLSIILQAISHQMILTVCTLQVQPTCTMLLSAQLGKYWNLMITIKSFPCSVSEEFRFFRVAQRSCTILLWTEIKKIPKLMVSKEWSKFITTPWWELLCLDQLSSHQWCKNSKNACNLHQMHQFITS